jgi:site-specific DNA-methyltransferase (adenine-specific)
VPQPLSFDPAVTQQVLHGDNLDVMAGLPDGLFRVVYLDPPFNTGKDQVRTTTSTKATAKGSRGGFVGRQYEVTTHATHSYADSFDDYRAFLEPRLRECWRVLAENGTLYVHLDWREVHYVKVWLDEMVGRDKFLNEIIWAYDYGGKSKKRWPTKHDTILVYVKNPSDYVFNSDAVDREPYMAPGLVDEEKRQRGKLPTDVWWHTIVSPTGKEKTGWATQKPLGVLRRIIQASSHPDDWVLDPFAGSGTTGAAAQELGRRFVMIDSHDDAIALMAKRLQL